MIAVIFELQPKDGHSEDYFSIAAALKQEVATIDGFISIERYQSISNDSKFLSLSFWRDEQAIKQWRNNFMHQSAQKSGREQIFKDYRLRVANVMRDYGLNARDEVPEGKHGDNV